MGVTSERLAVAMKARGLDQAGLARAVGISQGAISLILIGKTLRSRYLPDIADHLKVPLSWLEGKTDLPGEEAGEVLPSSLLPSVPAQEDHVMIDLLPTYAGAGGGGNGEGEHEQIAFARSLIEREFRARPSDMLAVLVLGDSMEPDFRNGDQLLIDKRATSITQPGAFCLWDGDGYVIKLLEKIYDSDPPKVRVISRNQIYQSAVRLAEEVRVMGRVVGLDAASNTRLLVRGQILLYCRYVPDRSLRPTPTACNRRLNALEFIRRYFVAHGASPSLREIAAAIDTSVQRACGIVRDLEVSGDILRGEGPRSIRLPDRADELSESELVLLARRRGLLVICNGRIEPADA